MDVRKESQSIVLFLHFLAGSEKTAKVEKWIGSCRHKAGPGWAGWAGLACRWAAARAGKSEENWKSEKLDRLLQT